MYDHKGYDLFIPESTMQTLDDYAQHGYVPGSFVEAVLCNNLTEAVGRADSFNQAALSQIVIYAYNQLPSDCWGSPEKYKAWLEMKREERETRGQESHE